MSDAPRRILIVKPSSLGDVVHGLPVLGLLKRRWPEARVSWLVTPACAGLLQGHPLLEEVILFDRRRYGSAWRSLSAASALWRLCRELRERRFDLVIDLQGLFRSGWLARRTRAPRRIGFANARELGWLYYTDRVRLATMDEHAVSRNIRIAAALGCASRPVEFLFPDDESDAQSVREMVGGVDPYAVLMPGANWATKRWPAERFASLVGPLRKRFGLRCVVAGGPDAAEAARRIAGATDLTGRTSLRQLVALLRGAGLVIANDSGPMHIAAALGRPLVVVFGPTNPVRTGPFGRDDCVVRLDMPCSPCYSRRCSHTSCLGWLEAEAVLDRARDQLANPPSQA